ncbi:SRPBCC family protein [Gordonia sp. NPDC003424]
MSTTQVLAAGVLAAGAAAVAYQRFARQPILNWGATPDEVAAVLPGDDLLPEPDGVSTRAITVEARPEHIYPWLAQMGPAPRGGAYTYDWIENLFGLHMHSTDQVLDEFQHPKLGDVIGLGPNRMIVQVAEPHHAFATRSSDGNWVWAFTLVERGDGTTRLISRNRFRLPTLKDRIGMLPMEPGSLVMERKMLHGIKERAEKLARERVGPVTG